MWVCLKIWSPLVPHIFQWFIILCPSNVVVWGHVHPFSNKPIFSVQWPSIFCEDLHVSLQVLIAQETLAPVRHGIFVGRWATLKFDGWSSFPYWKWFRIAEKLDLKKKHHIYPHHGSLHFKYVEYTLLGLLDVQLDGANHTWMKQKATNQSIKNIKIKGCPKDLNFLSRSALLAPRKQCPLHLYDIYWNIMTLHLWTERRSAWHYIL